MTPFCSLGSVVASDQWFPGGGSGCARYWNADVRPGNIITQDGGFFSEQVSKVIDLYTFHTRKGLEEEKGSMKTYFASSALSLKFSNFFRNKKSSRIFYFISFFP